MQGAITDPLLLYLSENQLVTDQQVGEVMEEHNRTGKPVRDIIVDMEVMSEHVLLHHVAALLGADLVDITEVKFTTEILRSIPSSIARMYNIVPVDFDGQLVTVATFEPLSPVIMDEIRFQLDNDTHFVVATESGIKDVLAEHYSEDSDSVSEMLTKLESELEDAGDVINFGGGEDDEIDLEQAAASAPIVRFVNLVLYQAAQDKASDIHFEPFETEFKIRYRVDGALYEMAPPPKHLALPVISRIKVMSGLNIAERRLPQDGRIQLNIGGRPIDFRVSTLPTQFGESVVLRVLDKGVVSLALENLGMPDDVYEKFSTDIFKPNGIVVVTGPTGSGKTTTLYSALGRINKVETKLLTAEDPVEYDVEGIIQVPVNEGIGLTFAKTLRAFLRQDPDVIMVGEIRDLETAQISIQASLTGHLVFSTLHTNDAAGAVTRLIDMNVEPFLIASTLQSVLGQRLVRTVCEGCKTPYTPEPDLLKKLNLTAENVEGRPFYFGEGCATCNNNGYKGRRGIYEYLEIMDPIKRLIAERRPTIVIRDKAIELGMRTLREDGVRCVLDGYTSAEEVLKYT